MSTPDTPGAVGTSPVSTINAGQVVLRPIAAPSILGLYGFAASAFGYWFIRLAAITWVGVAAALAENIALLLALLTLAVGATLLAIGLTASAAVLETLRAWVLILSAIVVFYTASALMLAATYHRPVLPVGPLAGRDGPQPPVSAEPGVHCG